MNDTQVAPKAELSENIQKFDEKVAKLRSKPKVYTENPFSWNAASKPKEAPVSAVLSAAQMIADPVYNEAGKILGIDTVNEWGLYYDKVKEVVDLAKEKSGIKDSKELSKWIYNQLNYAPSMGSKRINDVLTYLKMGGKPKQQPKPKVITKTVYKTKIKYVQPKETTEQFVHRWMKGQGF